MALEGKLQADFSSYYDAVDKAIVKQRDWEADAAKVEKRLSTMTDGFSGRRVIQEATLMAKAIEEAGGVTTLTDSELRRAGDSALEAAEKMKLLGMDVPAGIQSVADAALNLSHAQAQTGPTSERMRSSLREVDNILGVMGIHIMGEIKGLEQMTEVSGKTAAQLGTLATSGALAAAAFGGWSLGRKIAEFLDLDTAIANGTATLMGWGNLGAETAAARADVLATAWANTGKVVNNLNDAIRINQEFFQKHANATIDWEGRMQSARAAALSLTDEEVRQIQTARELGASTEQLHDKFGVTADTLKALDAQLQITSSNEQKLAAVQTQLSKARAERAEKELQDQERVNATLAKLVAENTAIEISMSGTKRDAIIADINAQAAAEIAQLTRRGELTAATEAEVERKRQMLTDRQLADFDMINDRSRTALEQRAEYEGKTYEEMARRSDQFSAEAVQAQREKWLSAQDDVRNWREVQAGEFGKGTKDVQKYQSDWENAFDQMRESVDQTAARVKTLNERVAESFSFDVKGLTGFDKENAISRFHQAGDTSDAQALQRGLDVLSAAEGKYAPKNNVEFFQMQKDQLLLEQLRQLKASGTIPGFAGGVENFTGGLAYVHKDEMLVNMPKGTSVIPAGRGGSGLVIQGLTIMANSRRDGENAGAAFISYLKSVGELLPN